MSQVNYDAMSKAQLKQYFLKHRGDRAAMPRILKQNQSVVRSELLRFLAILILMRKSKQRFAKNSKMLEVASNRSLIRLIQPTLKGNFLNRFKLAHIWHN